MNLAETMKSSTKSSSKVHANSLLKLSTTILRYVYRVGQSLARFIFCNVYTFSGDVKGIGVIIGIGAFVAVVSAVALGISFAMGTKQVCELYLEENRSSSLCHFGNPTQSIVLGKAINI